MKTTLHIDGKATSIELSFEDIASIVSNLPDITENVSLFDSFSLHPSAAVRENVAGKDKLSESIVHRLAKDKANHVLRSLVRSDKARECLDTEQLVSIVDRDIEAAKNIASYVESYGNADTDQVAIHLLKHTDPQVRNALAGNSSTPKKILKSLLKDVDSAVRESARISLE